MVFKAINYINTWHECFLDNSLIVTIIIAFCFLITWSDNLSKIHQTLLYYSKAFQLHFLNLIYMLNYIHLDKPIQLVHRCVFLKSTKLGFSKIKLIITEGNVCLFCLIDIHNLNSICDYWKEVSLIGEITSFGSLSTALTFWLIWLLHVEQSVKWCANSIFSL